MCKKYVAVLFTLLTLSLTAQAEVEWKEGEHYFELRPAQPRVTFDDKIEVTEVFSYGCIYCNRFYPIVDKLKASLPSNAKLVYLPASFLPNENWPMFQRAFCTADSLGLVEKTHDAMFDAVWKTGELAILDEKTQQLKKTMPTIEDAAKFYNRIAGVPVDKFIAAATKSFDVDLKVKRADELVKAYRVDGTPSIVVNGKYRINLGAVGTADRLVDLVTWLVQKESK